MPKSTTEWRQSRTNICVRTIRLTVLITIALIGCLLTQPARAERPRRSTPDDATRARVDTFLNDLSHELPQLVPLAVDSVTRQWSPRPNTPQWQSQWESIIALGLAEQRDPSHLWGAALVRRGPSTTAAGNSRPPENVIVTAVQWLDSLRVLWPHLDPSTRATLLVRDEGSGILLPVLLECLEQGVGTQAIASIATTLETTAQHAFAPNVEVGSLLGTGLLVRGAVALAQRDTVAAMAALWPAAAVQTLTRTTTTVPSTLPAARLLVTLATARHDTLALLRGLTLLRLQQPLNFAGESYIADALLHDVYPAVAATGQPMPDILPPGAHHADLPPATTPLTLDGYLDRQWGLLFDRSVTDLGHVSPVVAAKASQTHRVVVIEYESSLGCGGCWFEDRFMSAMARRYNSVSVIPLSIRANGADGPITGLEQDHSGWYWAWYPLDTTAKPLPLIPFAATLRSASGAELNSSYLVNGHGVSTVPVPGTTPVLRGALDTVPHPGRHANMIATIDSALQQSPEAQLRVTTAVQRAPGSVQLHVTTRVDAGTHPRANLAVRLMLVRDTVWLRSGSLRRLMFNPVLSMSHTPALPLGLPLPAQEKVPVDYTFDLTAIQRGITAQRTSDGWQRWSDAHQFGMDGTSQRDNTLMTYPDPRDWQIDWSHVFLVALVQDVHTSDILQAVRVPLGLS